MKRLLFTLFCLLLVVTAFAQTPNEHLKFMGIPITGTISQFQAKLKTKGVIIDTKESSKVNVGIRVFKGDFVGQNSRFYVYYSKYSSIVYRIKVLQLYDDAIKVMDAYSNLKEMIIRKYQPINRTDFEVQGINFPTFQLKAGTISVWEEDDFSKVSSGGGAFRIYLDYIDSINNEKNKSSLYDDI